MTRITLIAWACLFYLTNIVCAQQARTVDKVSITVSDLAQAVEFYTKVLSFQHINSYTLEGKPIQRLFGIRDKKLKVEVATLQLGAEQIELMEFHSSKKGRVIPHDSKSNDLWFQHIAIVVNDMEKAYAKVAEHKVEHVSTAPQTLPDYIPAATGIAAFYFRDPDDHNLELIYFPEGKGKVYYSNDSEVPAYGVDPSDIGLAERVATRVL